MFFWFLFEMTNCLRLVSIKWKKGKCLQTIWTFLKRDVNFWFIWWRVLFLYKMTVDNKWASLIFFVSRSFSWVTISPEEIIHHQREDLERKLMKLFTLLFFIHSTALHHSVRVFQLDVDGMENDILTLRLPAFPVLWTGNSSWMWATTDENLNENFINISSHLKILQLLILMWKNN